MKKINKRSPKKWHGKIADAVGEARCVWQGDVKILMTPNFISTWLAPMATNTGS